MDFRNDAVHLFYSPRFNDDKDKYVTGSMPRHMKVCSPSFIAVRVLSRGRIAYKDVALLAI